MKLIFTLAIFCVVAHARTLLDTEHGAEPSNVASVASKFESPSYKVLNKTKAAELREYDAATWAVSFGRSRWLTDFAAIQAGIGLAKYFDGANANKTKISATIPIVGTILPPRHRPPHKNDSRDDDPAEPEDEPAGPPDDHHHHHPHHHHPHHHPHPPPGPPAVVVAGYIPKSFKGSPPKPDSWHIKLFHQNSTQVYAHKFGGWALSWVIKHEIGHLAAALKDQGVSPCKGRFFVASYSDPWKFFGRKNEIWWTKRPSHHNSTDSLDGFEVSAVPFGVMDPLTLFPEEFPDEAGDPDFPEDGPADFLQAISDDPFLQHAKEHEKKEEAKWIIQKGTATS